ncbi:MAG: SCO family protein [Chitinophagia bacterium]|nr:SCO family protein [Chitinophagia bacterium]
MSRKGWLYLGFFVLLLAGFYGGLMLATDFGKVELPVLSKVRPFRFVRQDGVEVTERDVRGRVYVAEYFFTTCKGICPKMNRNMRAVYEAFGSRSDFLILSHTVDPETDSVARLKNYSDSMGVDTSRWWFLTGGKADLYRAARESYLLDSQENSSRNISEQFIHTQFFALVDGDGQVRGIYDGLKREELEQLKKDAASLLGSSPPSQQTGGLP